ncbi:MAG: hypothetical protein ACXVKK_03245, partial [Flavisolibacter sp.]
TLTERYYIQRLTDSSFLVRERQEGREPNADDRIIRVFEKSEDAHNYVKIADQVQNQLDKICGHWTQSAV